MEEHQTPKKIDVKVFIASSLSLKYDREEVKKAVDKLNEKDNPAYFFSYFDYIFDKRLVQQLELKDAQDAVRPFIKKSLVFVMIIRGRVGNLTKSEFEDALARYKSGRHPQHIMIFWDEDTSKDDLNDGKSMSYATFEKTYLETSCLDSAYREVLHKKAYYIPFGGNYGSLEKQVYENVSNLCNSMPIPGAIVPSTITAQDFYSDRNRIDNCYDEIYYVRSFDKELSHLIDENNVIMIQGASLSGKTRAAMRLFSRLEGGFLYMLPNTLEGLNCLLDRFDLIQNHYKDLHTHSRLYLFVDDAHDLDFSTNPKVHEEQMRRLRNFLLFIQSHDIALVLTSTQDETIITNLLGENYPYALVEIKRMSDVEYNEAYEFFRSYGLARSNNTQFRTLGSILIDLDAIKSSYRSFLQVSKDERAICQCLLKAIKAVSIWKRTNIGELNMLINLTLYFIGKNDRSTRMNVVAAINALRKLNQSGIVHVAKDRLSIQEYVYTFVLNCSGGVLDDNETVSFEDEKDLVCDIMSYCYDYNQSLDLDEQPVSLTEQAAKLGRRTTNRTEFGCWFYRLYTTNKSVKRKGQMSPEPWCKDYQEEFINAKDIFLQEGEKFRDNYSLIFANAMYGMSFEDALDVYEKSDESLRSPRLLAALLRTTDANLEQVTQLPEYEQFKYDPNVLCLLMSYAPSFDAANAYFSQMESNMIWNVREIINLRLKWLNLDYIEDKELLQKNFAVERCLAILAGKVQSEDDWQKLCVILRRYFYVRIADRSRLESLEKYPQTVGCKAEKLTTIDLLSLLNVYVRRRVIKSVFQTLDDAKVFMDKQIYACGATLLTIEKRNAIVASIVNALAERFKEEPFDARMEMIFKPAYPMYIDCYTYTFMLHNANFLQIQKIIRAVSLQLANPQQVLVLSTEFLNSLINSIYELKYISSELCRSYINRVEQLYDIFSVPRDIFTYNICIKKSQTLAQAAEYLSAMGRQNITPDKYTLVSYCSKMKDVEMILGLAVLDKRLILPNDFTPHPSLRECLLQKESVKWCQEQMFDNEEYWLRFFRCDVSEDKHRQIMQNCFEYLLNYNPDMLKDGKVLTTLVANTTYMVSFQDVWQFIDNYGYTHYPEHDFPNYHTFLKVCVRLSKLNPYEKRLELPKLNSLTQDMCRDGRISWAWVHQNRLLLFTSSREYLELCYPKKDGVELVNGDVKRCVSGIRKNYKEYTLKNLKAIHFYLRKLNDYKDNSVFFHEQIPYLSVEDYKDEDYSKDKVYLFNNELNALVDSKDFEDAVNMFNDFFLSEENKTGYDFERLYPSVETFSILVKFARSMEDVTRLYRMYDEARAKDNLLTMDGHFLGSQFPLNKTLAESHACVELFEKYGTYDIHTLEVFLTTCAKNDDDDDSMALMQELYDYFFHKGTSDWTTRRAPLPLISRENVTLNTLAIVMRHARKRCRIEDTNMLDEYCIGVLLTDYKHLLLYGLLSWTDMQAWTMFTFEDWMRILDACKNELKGKRVNSYALKFIIDRMSSFEEYCQFMEVLRAIEHPRMDDILKNILEKFYVQKSHAGWIRYAQNEWITDIRRLFASILTYCFINKLQFKHLLPSQPESPTDWDAKYFLGSDARQIVQSVVKEINDVNYWFKYVLGNLDEPYLMSLQLLCRDRDINFADATDKSKELLLTWEKAYAEKIKNGLVPFNEIRQCISQCMHAGRYPGVELVAALFCAYRKHKSDSDEEVKKEATKYYDNLNISLSHFKKQKDCLEYKFYLKDLGQLTDQEAARNLRVAVNKNVFYELTYVPKKK